MSMLHEPIFWIELGAIIWINLLVSGDNAVMIALAARSLPARQQKQAVFWGSTAAVALRVILTLFAVALLAVPWLKLAGDALLFWIGIRLLAPKKEEARYSTSNQLWHAAPIAGAVLVTLCGNLIRRMNRESRP